MSENWNKPANLREALQGLRLILWSAQITEKDYPTVKAGMAVLESAVNETDQQAARIAELENRNAALQLQVDTWRETEATTAVIGEEQCAKLQAEVARLREIARQYDTILANLGASQAENARLREALTAITNAADSAVEYRYDDGSQSRHDRYLADEVNIARQALGELGQ